MFRRYPCSGQPAHRATTVASYEGIAAATRIDQLGNRTTVTADLRAGGRSLFVDQRGYAETLREAGNYNTDTLDINQTTIDLKYENLLTGNPIWTMRTKGVAVITAEDAIAQLAILHQRGVAGGDGHVRLRQHHLEVVEGRHARDADAAPGHNERRLTDA